jgi:hypothetical protein
VADDRTAEDLALLRQAALVEDNPLATKDQRELEALAIALYETPELAAARARTALLWISRFGERRPSGEAMRSFDAAVAEFVFHCCLNAANSDAGRPRVLKVEGEPHHWFGMDVPGARRGGNNADNAYRIIPVDGSGRFEIVGQAGVHPPSDVTTTLIANTAMSKTVHTIEWRDVQVDSDGLFRLTVDPDPAGIRPNHFQSTPDCRYLFIRDTLTDWTRQRVNRLAARRLDAPPPAPGFAELVRRAAEYADNDMAYYWDMCMGQSYGFPVNVIPPVRNAGAFGGLVSQSGSTGHYKIDDDQALVVTVTQGNAPYMSLMAHDPWWRTLDFAPRTASLNNAQILPDADGAFTFVIAPRDPGVHNWIDTGGIHEGIFYFRWQGLPPDDPHPPVVRSYELARIADLASVMPAGTTWATCEERKAQQEARRLAVAGWWNDGAAAPA